MAMVFLFQVDGWERSPEKDHGIIRHLVQAQANINLPFVVSGRYPRLYHSGVRYKEETDGDRARIEVFRDIPSVLARGGSDCNNLTAWRKAEKDAAGEPSDIYVSWEYEKTPRGFKWSYHVCLILPGGRLEDPSQILSV